MLKKYELLSTNLRKWSRSSCGILHPGSWWLEVHSRFSRNLKINLWWPMSCLINFRAHHMHFSWEWNFMDNLLFCNLSLHMIWWRSWFNLLFLNLESKSLRIIFTISIPLQNLIMYWITFLVFTEILLTIASSLAPLTIMLARKLSTCSKCLLHRRHEGWVGLGTNSSRQEND